MPPELPPLAGTVPAGTAQRLPQKDRGGAVREENRTRFHLDLWASGPPTPGPQRETPPYWDASVKLQPTA